ncbi:MAG: RES family NAD+ phosphorylase [Gammaproteobacteria bacterium]
MQSTLFDKIQDLNQDVFRNIVSLAKSQDLFDDLYENTDGSDKIAQIAEARVKMQIPGDMLSRGFHYTTAIEYPFHTENFHATRFGDGSYPCWYAATDLKTSVYETAYHTMRDLLNADIKEIVIRERAVYKIHCRGLLIDLTHKNIEYPDLINKSNYVFTQAIGKRIYTEGHPGLITNSARLIKGENSVLFKQDVLNNPRVSSYLTYKCDAKNSEVFVYKYGSQQVLYTYRLD